MIRRWWRRRRSTDEYGPMMDRLKFDSLNVDENGHVNLTLLEEYDDDTSKRVMEAMVVSLIHMLGNAENYVEMRVSSGRLSPREYVVTVRRAERPTPHELRRQAERERDDALARLNGARPEPSGSAT